MISEQLLGKLTESEIAFKQNVCLSDRSTFRIGGECAVGIFPSSEEQLALAVSLLDRENVRIHICGRGSNTLFADGRLEIAVIFTSQVDGVSINGESISCGAGAGLVAVSNVACNAGLTGMEFASGIPGSMGGAVFMNEGAYGSSMENVVINTRAYDRSTGNITVITDNGFGYRQSVYKSNAQLLCLGAELKLKKGNTEQIRAKMRELSEQRRKKQPLEFASAGSYFKRPEGDFAGRLIEICGLKGTRIGGAEVSDKHAGFIINRNNATFDDVLRLEEVVKETVMKQTGVVLEREVEVIK